MDNPIEKPFWHVLCDIQNNVMFFYNDEWKYAFSNYIAVISRQELYNLHIQGTLRNQEGQANGATSQKI